MPKKTRLSPTNSWQGTLLQDSPTKVLQDLASGKIGTESKLRRKEAAKALQERKVRIKRNYQDRARDLQLVYGQIIRCMSFAEAEHLCLIFDKKELTLIYCFFKGKVDFERAIELMRKLGLSLDGTGPSDCANLLDMFQLEARHLWPSYLSKAENVFGTVAQDLPGYTGEELARRRRHAKDNPEYIGLNTKARPIPVPKKNQPTRGLKPKLVDIEPKPTRREVPMPTWFEESTDTLPPDVQRAFWPCVIAMAESGWFSASACQISEEHLDILMVAGEVQRMERDWYRVSKVLPFLKKLDRLAIPKPRRAPGPARPPKKREPESTRKSARRYNRDHKPPVPKALRQTEQTIQFDFSEGETKMKREDVYDTKVGLLPEKLRPYVTQLLKGTAVAGTIGKALAGITDDDPELKELIGYSAVAYVKGSTQLRWVSPYSLGGRAIPNGVLTTEEVLKFWFQTDAEELPEADGTQTTEPTAEVVATPAVAKEPSPAPAEPSKPSEDVHPPIEQPPAPQVESAGGVTEAPFTESSLTIQFESVIEPIGVLTANHLIQSSINTESFDVHIEDGAIIITTADFKIVGNLAE